MDGQDNSVDDSDRSATVADEDVPPTASSAPLQPPPPQTPPSNGAEVKSLVGVIEVNEVPAVKTPDRHLRPLESARDKRRERLARDSLQSVKSPVSVNKVNEVPAVKRWKPPNGACFACEKVIAECDWDVRSLDIGVALCKHCTWRKL